MPLFVKLIITVTSYLQPNADISAYIANSHTLFNSINALIFLPLTKYYVKFLNTIIRPKDNGHTKQVILDRLLLDTPVAALQASRSEIIRGAGIAKEMLVDVIDLLYTGDTKN